MSRGVATVELDTVLQADDHIPLTDDGQTHGVRVVLGEKAKEDLADDETENTQQQPASNS